MPTLIYRKFTLYFPSLELTKALDVIKVIIKHILMIMDMLNEMRLCGHNSGL